MTSDPGEPETIDQALSGPESVQWHGSMKDEVNDFLKRKAWKAVPIERVKEEGRKGWDNQMQEQVVHQGVHHDPRSRLQGVIQPSGCGH